MTGVQDAGSSRTGPLGASPNVVGRGGPNSGSARSLDPTAHQHRTTTSLLPGRVPLASVRDAGPMRAGPSRASLDVVGRGGPKSGSGVPSTSTAHECASFTTPQRAEGNAFSRPSGASPDVVELAGPDVQRGGAPYGPSTSRGPRREASPYLDSPPAYAGGLSRAATPARAPAPTPDPTRAVPSAAPAPTPAQPSQQDRQ